MTLWEQFAPELITDFYEFTMAASYLDEGMSGDATFSLFIRDYPPGRAYFVSAGLDHLLQMIGNLSFNVDSIEYLASLGKFSSRFLDYLKEFRFTGTVRAIPEGRIFFTQEPLIEVTAPIIEAQLIETLVINTLQLETLIASKAARCVHAAGGKPLIDFSLRRTHGAEAGLKAARASYLVGFSGTSNVLAGRVYGIPVYGTMAHSYITSFDRELDSFFAFARAFPDDTVLLIDTYDTVCGAKKAVKVARRQEQAGSKLRGVRLDSGDLSALSREVRRLLLEAGLPDVKILVSGNLDEFKMEELLQSGAEIDLFAVGTRMGVSADAPYLDIAYKLVEYEGRPVLKLSSGKKTWVGKKQVYRFYDGQGQMKEDVLGLASELLPRGEPLLQTVMADGKPLHPRESLEAVQGRFAKEWESLPAVYRSLRAEVVYPVRVSPALRELDDRTTEQKRQEEIEKGC